MVDYAISKYGLTHLKILHAIINILKEVLLEINEELWAKFSRRYSSNGESEE